MRAWSWVLVLLVGCANASESDDAAIRDGGMAVRDAGAPPRDGGATIRDAGFVDADWHAAHCEDRECYFVMQSAPGASNLTCNGRSPTDLGTLDADGLKNCPFLGFDNPTLRALMAPTEGANTRRSFFVGAGRYPMWPGGVALRGDGESPDDGVLLSNYKGADVTLAGDECPASCTIETTGGTFTKTPCCALDCPSCSADPSCQPVIVNGEDSGECGIPWDKVYRPLTVSGSWLRVEGVEIDGCANDALVVSARHDSSDAIVPNGEIFVTNNTISGCDINENIKAFAQGPGPSAGGPTWGRTHVIGNELFDMNSQAIDATGVHNWVVEESYVHDAKTVHPIPGQEVDGGGIGFKNGGSQARVRNNWLVRGGSFALGGGSGSCVQSATGCFQEFEMTDMLVENNTAIESAMQNASGSGAAIGVFHCDDCRVIGNVIENVATKNAVYLSDECPGTRCTYNPRLKPTRDLQVSSNFLSLGPWSGGPRLFMGYPRDVHPAGPVANGMISTDNTFCAASGSPPEFGGPESPAESIALWYYFSPDANMAFLPNFAPQIGDVGSRVFNSNDATVEPCPSAPDACNVAIAIREGVVRWRGPDCPTCTCALVLDDEPPVAVDCAGEQALGTLPTNPGRHYAGLRVAGPKATGCGASFDVAAEMRGAGCTIGVEGSDIYWTTEGAVSCALVADGGIELGPVPCEGTMSLPAVLRASGRHHVRLRVEDSPLGQTTCGATFNR